jgi:FkbM family methyltransferase
MMFSIKKPEYYLQPVHILRRFIPVAKNEVEARTPWGHSMQVDNRESIGKAIFRTGIYDLALTEVLWRLVQPGNFVLDIGANIGYTAGLCSVRTGAGGKVWAFEPNPLVLGKLKNNLLKLPYPNVQVFEMALSSQKGEGVLQMPDAFEINQGTAFIGKEKNEHSVTVPLEKLDDLLPPGTIADVIKIDVEGHELSVFEGAPKALAAKKIRHIVFEDHLAYPSPVCHLLLQYGYEIFRIEKGWFGVALKDPLQASGVSSWEPVNYIASVNTGELFSFFKNGSYQCFG